MRTADPVAPPRPGLPLLLPCSLGLWTASAIVYACARTVAVDALTTILTIAGAFAAIGIVTMLLLIRCTAPTALVLLLSALLGCGLGAACGCAGALGVRADAARLADADGPWRIELVSDAEEGAYGISARAMVRAQSGDGAEVSLQLARGSDLDRSELTVGTVLRGELSFSAPTESNAEYLWGQGICAAVRASALEREAPEGLRGAVIVLRDRAIGLIVEHGGEEAGVLAALVCGHRIPLEESGAYEDYKTVGLAHVVAVSGAHLAIVTAVLGAALRALRVPRRPTLAVMALFAVAYVVFAGVPVSAVRAAFMVLLMLVGRAVHRRNASLNALALCVIAFVVADPAVAVSVSFFLSCASTFGIVLFAPLFSWWFSFLPERLRKPVGDPIALTLASNVATLPYSAALFSQVPLIAPLSNVVAAPLFSLGCVFGLVATLLGCLAPAAAPALIGLAAVAARPLSVVAGTLADVPFACIPVWLPVAPMIVLSALFCAALWRFWPSLSVRVVGVCALATLLCTGALLFVLPSLRGPAIVMLDVGQGDSFLLRSGAHALLVDTGDQDAKLRESLGRNGVYSLDAVLITHGDDDHCGSLEQLAAVTQVGRVLLAADALVCDCDACMSLRQRAAALVGEGNVIGLSVGDVITVGAFELHVVWPGAFTDEGGNADSVCVVASLDVDADGSVDWRALFCGDVESEQLEQLESAGRLGAVDVLKVGHHGSRVALTPELLEVLRPSVALIGVGANNRYGHPTPETLSYLEEADAVVFRTDLQGDVTLSFTVDRMSVECEVQ